MRKSWESIYTFAKKLDTDTPEKPNSESVKIL